MCRQGNTEEEPAEDYLTRPHRPESGRRARAGTARLVEQELLLPVVARISKNLRVNPQLVYGLCPGHLVKEGRENHHEPRLER